MIAFLRGTLADKRPDQAIVDIQGVGYRALIPRSTYNVLPAVGEPVKLLTVTHVREDLFRLYGFATDQEKEIFELMNHVSGIAVKLALAALSTLSPEAIVNAINQEDVPMLSRIQGVGRKTAQRMVVELKDRLATITTLSSSVSSDKSVSSRPTVNMRGEITSALLNLGYRPPQVDHVLAQLFSSETGIATTEEGVRVALGMLLKR